MRPFEFVEPTTLSEAAALLSERAGEARLLAGGQSLLPMMSAKLVNPGLLVSLGRIPELRQITWDDGGGVRIGAMVTQRTLERSPELRQRCPVLAYAASKIASPHVRNLGTLGGNLAHNLVGLFIDGDLTGIVKYDNISEKARMTRPTRPISWISGARKQFEKFPEETQSICLAGADDCRGRRQGRYREADERAWVGCFRDCVAVSRQCFPGDLRCSARRGAVGGPCVPEESHAGDQDATARD